MRHEPPQYTAGVRYIWQLRVMISGTVQLVQATQHAAGRNRPVYAYRIKARHLHNE